MNPVYSGLFFAHTGWVDPLRVRIVAAHQNCIAVAYPHFVACFKQRENNGFQTVFTSPYLEHLVERVALNAKMSSVMGLEQITTMIAASFDRRVRLMGFTEDGARVDVGTFDLGAVVHRLFFIGTQGPNSIDNIFGLSFGLKNHLNFGLRFHTQRKCSKMVSLDMSQNQNGISIRFSSQNSSQNVSC